MKHPLFYLLPLTGFTFIVLGLTGYGLMNPPRWPSEHMQLQRAQPTPTLSTDVRVPEGPGLANPQPKNGKFSF